MVVFFYGTTGGSIKIATLVEAVPEENRLLIDTNQQPKLLEKFYSATSFPPPDIILSRGWRGNDLTKPWQMLVWLFTVLTNFIFSGVFIRLLKLKKRKNLVIVVHGDTVTTVLGALFGRILGIKVAHLEAGLRSGNWKHPFPEEIDRRIVGKLARLHYPPGEVPERALLNEKTKGDIINTHANTVADSAIWARKQKPQNLPKLPTKFCLVSVHRNEFLVQSKQVEEFLKTLAELAKRMPVVFLDHPITESRIRALNLDNLLEVDRLTRVPKQNYINMIHILKEAEVLITDSGGLQEESYYIGIPCIVFREATERTEGLGENVVLSGINSKQLKNELKNYKKLKVISENKFKPTEIILEDLKQRSFV